MSLRTLPSRTIGPTFSSFSYAEMLREAEREVRARKHVYPNRVLTKRGRMTAKLAARRIALMEAIRGVLAELAKTERLL